MELKDVLIGFVIVGLFSLSLIMFAAQTAVDNDANSSILDDEKVSNIYGNLNESLSSYQSKTNTTKASFEGDAQGLTGAFFILPSIIGAVKTFLSMAVGMFNLLFLFVFDTLGINPIVFGVLASILIVTLILLAWKTLRGA